MSCFSLFERLSLRLCEPFLKGLTGQLNFTLPDGSIKTYGGKLFANSKLSGQKNTVRRADITLTNGGFFSRVVLDGGVGLGESFVAGEWSSDNLPQVMAILLEGLTQASERKLQRVRISRLAGRIWHWMRRNTPQGSQKNIYAHYDLGNSLFSELLDPTMTYSSAMYRSGAETLEDAQLEKLREVARKAQIQKDDHVLEIGTGWGSFAIVAARDFGARVTTTTISREQYDVAVKRIAAAGLSDRITVLQKDYRELTGQYDKLVSIEMMEAIGERFLPVFFAQCEKLLKPDGLMVVQVIAMLDGWYDEYRTRVDWIQKYIFPGSHLPSLGKLVSCMTTSTNFVVEKLENIPHHYARTLATWRSALAAREDKLEQLGYDENFRRMFDYYFAVCEAEFGTRLLNLYQIVFTQPNNQKLIAQDAVDLGQSANHTSLHVA